MATILFVRSAAMIILASLASSVSQASLAPVYGGINVAVNHKQAVAITSGTGFILGSISKSKNRRRIFRYLPVVASWIPLLEFYQFLYSGSLGPIGGPIISGFTSCHILVIMSTSAASSDLQDLGLSRKVGALASFFVSLVIGVLIPLKLEGRIRSFSSLVGDSLPWNNLSGLGPVEIQIGMAFVYLGLALARRRSVNWTTLALMIPAVLHACFMNPHSFWLDFNSKLDSSLTLSGWTLLDRQWSTTGYLSVLENKERAYRVLRCDHSLLGGEWQLTAEREQKEGWKVTEPIYSVFEMLEAVRLMNLSPKVADADAKALVVGLGVGTAPKAFVSHGIDTTVVELDPVVHDFATKYFGLPKNHTSVLRDAVGWVEAAVADHEAARYDYLLHDVFTGGAEPLVLFNVEFIQNLRGLLRPNGVAAINYAGDLALPLTGRILNTVSHVFEGQCKIFRDGAPPTETEMLSTGGIDFVNMVVFCRNTPGPITFRQPTKADFLDSKSREHYLYPRADYEIPFPLTEEGELLHRGQESDWDAQQAESAKRHWKIMRTVMPDQVWELW